MKPIPKAYPERVWILVTRKTDRIIDCGPSWEAVRAACLLSGKIIFNGMFCVCSQTGEQVCFKDGYGERRTREILPD